MKDYLEGLQAVQQTPVPNLLILAGLVFLVLSFASKVGGFIELNKERQKWAAILGVLLLVFGVALFAAGPLLTGVQTSTAASGDPGNSAPPAKQTATASTPARIVITATDEPKVTLTEIVITVTLEPTVKPPEKLAGIPDEEYSDSAYQDMGMHACKPGYAIAGVNANDNVFLCRRVQLVGEESFVDSLIEPSIQRHNMLACPVGTYMRGLNIGANQILCSFDRRVGREEYTQASEFEDTTSQGNNMHICPKQTDILVYQTGIRVDENRFLCARHHIPYAAK